MNGQVNSPLPMNFRLSIQKLMIDWLLINDSEGNCEKDMDQFLFKLGNKKNYKKDFISRKSTNNLIDFDILIM